MQNRIWIIVESLKFNNKQHFVLTCARKRFIELCNTFAKKLLLLAAAHTLTSLFFMNEQNQTECLHDKGRIHPETDLPASWLETWMWLNSWLIYITSFPLASRWIADLSSNSIPKHCYLSMHILNSYGIWYIMKFKVTERTRLVDVMSSSSPYYFLEKFAIWGE